jgi:serine/threonine protein kinase
MSKLKILDRSSLFSIKSEHTLLSLLSHPFLINMHYSFQDINNLYLVLDLKSGGDLRYQICLKKFFNENETKFLISCMILQLEYIHYNKILHRDLKPENLIMDHKGYLYLTDFGIARIQCMNNKNDTSGTPGYMAPEVICRQEHGIAVDYFALGVICYELMMGKRPYIGNNRKEIKENIMNKQVRIEKYNNQKKEGENNDKIYAPKDWSIECIDFINKLLIRIPSKRLGYNGPLEVKNHVWFKDFPWEQLYMKIIHAPYIPQNKDNFDYKFCNSIEKIGEKTKERYDKILKNNNFETIFNDYYYYDRKLKKNIGDEIKDIIKFKNPHLLYEIQYDIRIEKNRNRENKKFFIENKNYSENGFNDINDSYNIYDSNYIKNNYNNYMKNTSIKNDIKNNDNNIEKEEKINLYNEKHNNTISSLNSSNHNLNIKVMNNNNIKNKKNFIDELFSNELNEAILDNDNDNININNDYLNNEKESNDNNISNINNNLNNIIENENNDINLIINYYKKRHSRNSSMSLNNTGKINIKNFSNKSTNLNSNKITSAK